ncbi:MAG: hypothetical protein PVJ55_06505 [Anaerolineae bacterium]|jgi:hypothetical protein
MSELVGPVIGAVLSLLVLSYLIGDNPLYRMALHVFVGALTGYSLGVVLREVLGKMVLQQLLDEPSTVLVPLILGLLVVSKGFPKRAYMGNFPVAYLVGVGTAVALGGALLGTLVPQVLASGQALGTASSETLRLGVLDGIMIVLGTVCTLLAFTFAQPGRRGDTHDWKRVLDGVAQVGRVFLIIAYGLAFSGAITASLSMFIGRLQYIVDSALRAMGL